MDEIKQLNDYIKTIKNNGAEVKEISDGYHTFKELYDERRSLFCALCNAYPNNAWKSKKHYDDVNDPMFNCDFIAGISTEDGMITYHFKLEYWDDFLIKEIPYAPKYNGYSSDDVMYRLKELN